MKVVLAYSGGLDTSVILKYLQEKYKAEVITFSADLGQGEDLEKIKEKALKTGAVKAYVLDLKEEFLRDFVLPALQMGALYEGKYPLATALSRPLIAKYLVEIAKKEKADAVAHGCTGKGNDQVRFEVSIKALAPELEVLAPVREWEFKTREEEYDYARKHGIPVPVSREKPYSIDQNIWGVSIEAGPLENPWQEPPEDAFVWTTSPQKAPDTPEYVEIGFERGVPVTLNGVNAPIVELVSELNRIASRHGVGRIDMVEDRLVGIKSREVYEAPAATVLYAAHRAVEELTLDRETLQFKDMLSIKYSQLVYYGYWYSPLREALDAFCFRTQQRVSGKVKLKLFKGGVYIAGRASKYSLYRYELATYGAGDMFDQSLAKGFVALWGLPLRVFSEAGKNADEETERG